MTCLVSVSLIVVNYYQSSRLIQLCLIVIILLLYERFHLIQCVQANPSSFEVLWIGCYVSMVSNILLVVAKYFAC